MVGKILFPAILDLLGHKIEELWAERKDLNLISLAKSIKNRTKLTYP